jgi:BstXI-like restriction endonuclease
MARVRIPRLPALVERKLYKTGQTRGATKSEIYQNRVGRNSTVLIPFSHWRDCLEGHEYENGSIVLISPETFFENPDAVEESQLVVGSDALVFYTSRSEWSRWDPFEQRWTAAKSRLHPLGGEFVARIPGTTSSGVNPILEGFTSSALRGAGIRVYEYADVSTIVHTKVQLEELFWRCFDAEQVLRDAGMSGDDIRARREHTGALAREDGLADDDKLRKARAIDAEGCTICPLCLDRMSAGLFSMRVQQAAGRERLDSNITEASLFHIEELRVGKLGHRSYNLGWGHHHCNVVAKDAGIPATLEWMERVVRKNGSLD